MESKAKTVRQYLASLPADRREAIQAVREVILANLDDGYEEGMQYGMIGYYIPHRVYPPGYHCDPMQPVPFAGLASQKNHMSIYLMGLGHPSVAGWFGKAWAKTGKKLDIGKCCVRFKRVEDLALEVIGEAIRRVPAEEMLAFCEALVGDARTAKKSAAGKGSTRNGAATKKAGARSKGAAAKKKSVAPKKASTRKVAAGSMAKSGTR
jgi:hypothetical protein